MQDATTLQASGRTLLGSQVLVKVLQKLVEPAIGQQGGIHRNLRSW